MKDAKHNYFAIFTNFFDSENFGKLFLRLMLGAFFIASGVKYFAGGLNMLETFGKIFSAIGLSFFPKFCGIASALVLILSGMCFVIGFFFKLNSCLLLFIFAIKTIVNWKISHNYWNSDFLCSLILVTTLISYIFIGPGQFSSDKK